MLLLFRHFQLLIQIILHKSILISIFQFQASRRVDDLFEDLRDGDNLLSLLEVLSGEHLVSITSALHFIEVPFKMFPIIFILAKRKRKNAFSHASKRSNGFRFSPFQKNQISQYSSWRHCRWKSKINSRFDLDDYFTLPGKF